MNKALQTYYTARALGWGNLPRRAWQVLKGRLGIIRRQLPGGELSTEALREQFVSEYDAEQTLSRWKRRAARFFVAPETRETIGQLLDRIVDATTWDEKVTSVGRRLRSGQMSFFNHLYADVGFPPKFNRNPIHGVDWPVGRHWSEYPQFDPALKDLKCVWEQSRFAWAYALARDFVRRGDETEANLFWEILDEWDKQNPYGLTPQWACGQEGTFRMFAWLFAAMATLGSDSATGARLHRITELIWYTGRHVERNINYARGQKNNHALSEAASLLTIGLLFPELRRAGAWRAKGREVIETDLGRQTYSDGSYVQHSLNYHRVMLDDLLWAARLAELHDQPLSQFTLARLERALYWLIQMIEPESGRVPNYGSNDGAQVLPLSTCDYVDFRPVAQATHYLLHRERCFQPGPWDEKMLWLFGPEALDAPVRSVLRQAAFRADAGGYYTFKGPRTWGMVRRHSYRDRPSQADMLHFDLWLGSQNVLRDAGTYHYYADPPWQNYFHSTAAHNTVEIDGADQMIKGPRFLWFRWTKSRLNRFEQSADSRLAYFEGEHYGYTRLPGRVVHRRSILRIDDTYVIVDDLLGAGEHDVALRWRLCEAEWKSDDMRWTSTLADETVAIGINAPVELGATLLRGQETPTPEGWESLYYAERTPTPSIVTSGRACLPMRIATLVTVGLSTAHVADRGAPDRQFTIAGIDDSDLESCLADVSGGRLKHA